MDLAACGMLISGIRELLRDHFVSDDVLLIPRNCNAVAHNLARLGMRPGYVMCLDRPPHRICKLFVVS
jgi:hypothetical protein